MLVVQSQCNNYLFTHFLSVDLLSAMVILKQFKVTYVRFSVIQLEHIESFRLLNQSELMSHFFSGIWYFRGII